MQQDVYLTIKEGDMFYLYAQDENAISHGFNTNKMMHNNDKLNRLPQPSCMVAADDIK